MNPIFDIDLTEIFKLSLPPFEIILRGSVMYWFLFFVFRFILRRDIGSVGVTDFLFIVILGDAVQNAMIGDGKSTADGMLLVTTLVFWNYSLDWLTYHFKWFEKFSSSSRLCLARDGKFLKRNMRKELITVDEVYAKIHAEGLEDISETKNIYMEPDGEITVIKRDKD